jgi:colanic acid/amylovoran biosynthesis glycosyltransferase
MFSVNQRDRQEIPNTESKVTVAHINYRFFERSETFIHFYLSNFKHVHPICMNWSLSPIVNEDLFTLPWGESYSYTEIKTKRYTPSWLCNAFLRRFDRLLWPTTWQRPPDHVSRLTWAKGILHKTNVHLIHAHFGPIGWIVLPLKQRLGLPLVTSFYGFDVTGGIDWEGPDLRRRQKQLFDRGDLFLVEGPFMRQRLIELGCQPDKVEIQRIAIPVRKMPFRVRKPKRDDKVSLLFAGRFTEKKGLIYALQAVRELCKSRRNVEFRIIGDGKLAPQIQAFIHENNLEYCTKLLGFLSHQDYLREMQQADIFLHPSVVAANGDSEGGAPTVILEAQALGMPVLSTYHADIPNITIPGESALLVPERDTDALINGLIYLLEHQERWEKMGRAGRSHVERFHNIDREILRLEEKYFSLLNHTSYQD